LVGKTLGHYEILELLGKGGMGEVYRARDTKLDRDVAIKVLPEDFAGAPDRLARLQREAKLLAALNHPNIATVHALEGEGKACFLVLELVKGESLERKLASGTLSVEKALDICKQIAEALEAAHGHGIIHRDLKPANVLVTPDGRAKVLDFGIAKSMQLDAGLVTTARATTLTVAGTLVGTPSYMSPEQVRGETLDKRTDIWAFGCVLYEALAGRRPFDRETVADTLAAIIEIQPDWRALPVAVPAIVESLVRRCLQKDRHRRLHDIADARIEIEEALLEPSVPSRARRREHVVSSAAGGVAILLAAFVGAVLAWISIPGPQAPPLRKFDLPLAAGEESAPVRPVISPDGSKVVFEEAGRLWIHEFEALEQRELVDTIDARAPMWSPDSEWLAFNVGQELRIMRVGGGESSFIGEIPDGISLVGGGGWTHDGRIVFSTGVGGLLAIPAQGGEWTTLIEVDEETEEDLHTPSLLPDGRGVLFISHGQNDEHFALDVYDGTRRKELFREEGRSLASPVYSVTGHILYNRLLDSPGIWAVPFSLSTLEITGDAFPLVPWGGNPSVSDEGTLVYTRGMGENLRELVWVDRRGNVEETVGSPQEGIVDPVLSPDEKRIAVSAAETGNPDIWLHAIEDGTTSRLTFSEDAETHPAWSPTGDQIAFQSDDGYLWIIDANPDGADARRVTRGTQPAFSADGDLLFVNEERLWYVALDGNHDAIPIGEPGGRKSGPVVSPDGTKVAYGTRVFEDPWQVLIARFPQGDGDRQADAPGQRPRWSRDGRMLTYVDRLGEVKELDANTLTSVTLFSSSFLGPRVALAGFDISSDNQRILMVRQMGQDGRNNRVTVIQNLSEELKQRVPTGGR
jgi:serine/threonine protein kinase